MPIEQNRGRFAIERIGRRGDLRVYQNRDGGESHDAVATVGGLQNRIVSA